MSDGRTFRNEDLILKVSTSYDPGVFKPERYQDFIEALCQGRSYQITAINTVLRYWLGEGYSSLRHLADENYQTNPALRERYRRFADMERHLQLPDQLSCTVDMATGSGKSYVMYGLARIMLAAGAVDRVLVLTPSSTVEDAVAAKFTELTQDVELGALLPADAVISNPSIIRGTSSLTTGSICIENFHQSLPHVSSSIRASLNGGRGERTLVLNDEVHHVYKPPGAELRRWKEFLLDSEFGFKYIGGFSGTCYVDNEYFNDVVHRYSLRQGMEDGVLKLIDYVAEDSSPTALERFQKIHANHRRNRDITYRAVKPLTILVTKDISACKRLRSDLVEFLAETEGISHDQAAAKVLIVTSANEHRSSLARLVNVDSSDSPVEYITSVSMLTEGWDVHNVFQIVPHEKRAFDSKLLIAQVLGRGLRIPSAYVGRRPTVTVFNHDAWSRSIKGLVDEVLEIEKRLVSRVVGKPRDYNFDLHNLRYSRDEEVEEVETEGTDPLKQGYVPLVSQVVETDRSTMYVGAFSGQQYEQRTNVKFKMHSVESVARHIAGKLNAIDLEEGTDLSSKYPLRELRTLIRESLRRVGEADDVVSEVNRQKLQNAFGSVTGSRQRVVRYSAKPGEQFTINTSARPESSVAVASLRHGDSTVFYDALTATTSDSDTAAVLEEVLGDESLPRSASEEVPNTYNFKTPVNLVLTNHTPERKFVRLLVREENASCIDAWVKSSDQSFYPIEYAYKVGTRARRGTFNPDFFIKSGGVIHVVEIKDDSERADASDENRAKYGAAVDHFNHLNGLLSDAEYRFNFLTPQDFELFFSFIRNGKDGYVSGIDAELRGES